MKFTFGRKINLMGFFGRSEIAQPMRFAAMRYISAPFILEEYNAHKPRFIPVIWLTNILRIAGFVYNAQIIKSVIAFYPVNVINKALWPFIGHIQPCQTMRFIDTAFNTYCKVSFFVSASGNVADFDRSTRANSPSKNARIGIISQYISQRFCCKFDHGPTIAFSS
jgi:hypothetical protein